MAKEGVFDMGQFMADQGMKLVGVTDKGQYEVETGDGQRGLFDAAKVVSEFKLDPSKVDIQFNDPTNPLDTSPVGHVDRMKLAVGNTSGQLSYLKSKFDDAAVSEDHGLMVKNKGVWQKVDQSSMDPWELTKDIIEGAVSLIPTIAGSAMGAAEGAAVGAAAGPVGAAVGSVVGAGAGGGGAELVRTSLGRLAGTYQASPTDQLKDIGWEALLNAGGQTVALGAKPGLAMLRNAVKSISTQAAPATKEVLASVLGRTTGAGEVATMTMFDHTDDVVAAMGKAQAGAKTTTAAVENLRRSQLETIAAMVKEAPDALSKKFGQLVDDIGAHVGEGFEAHIGDTVRQAQQSLVEAGYGKFVAEGGEAATKTGLLDAMGNPIMSEAKESGKKVFRLLTDAEVLANKNAGLPGQFFDGETHAQMSRMVDVLNKYAKLGKVKGPEAAKALMEVKKAVNAAAGDIIDANAPASVVKFVNDFRSSLSNTVGSVFNKVGPVNAKTGTTAAFDAYDATSKLYERFASAVNFARRTAHSENGGEVLLNKLIQGVGANQTYKDLAADMAELMGKQGLSMLKSLQVQQAARGFMPIIPKATLGGLTVGASATGAAAATGMIVPAAVAGAGMASPRMVLKQVQYGKKVLGLLQSMPEHARVQWLKDPRLVDATFRTITQALGDEDRQLQGLLVNSGVVQ